MAIRRSLLMQQTQLLPPEYQQVEYVQSDGTAYIKSGVNQSNDLGFDCTFWTANQLASSDYGCIFGSRYSSRNNDLQLTTYSDFQPGKGTLRFGSLQYDANIARETKQSVSLRNLVYTDPSGVSQSISSSNWKNLREVYLFLLNNNKSPTQGGNGCRIYDFKFYDGDTLIRQYIPCYRKSDNVVGMYETKTKQFLTTPVGTLTAGSPV